MTLTEVSILRFIYLFAWSLHASGGFKSFRHCSPDHGLYTAPEVHWSQLIPHLRLGWRNSRFFRARVLIVEDAQIPRDLLVGSLLARNYIVDAAATLEQAEAHLTSTSYQALILNIKLPDGNGIDFIPRVQQLQPDLPLMIWTGTGYLEPLLLAARRQGVASFLSKRLPLDQLAVDLQRITRVPRKQSGIGIASRSAIGSAPTA